LLDFWAAALNEMKRY
jgi:serine/threonine protein kinase